MSENDNSSTFFLNLDSSEFITKAVEAKYAITDLGNTENLTGLIDGLTKVGLAVGVIGVAFLAIREAFEATFDAEKIEMTRNEFDNLSKSAGVYSEDLKKGLVESARGWADETSLMQSANKAMVELQGGVEKLPELMNLARQATAQFGGNLTDNFDNMARAIAAGNTRGLRAVGIIVDQQKAYRDYAESIGATVSTLSKAGQQQAIMNAALEQGKTKFAGMNEDVRASTNSWAQFKSTITEVGEILELTFHKFTGGYFKSFFGGLKAMADDAKTYLTAKLGEGPDAVKAKYQVLNDSIRDVRGEIYDLTDAQEKAAKSGTFFSPEKAAMLTALKARLKEYETELGNVTTAKNKLDAAENKDRAAVTPVSAPAVDYEKQKAEKAKFAKDMATLDEEQTKSDIKQMTTVEQAQKLYDQQRLADAAKIQAQIDQIQSEKGKTLSAAQADAEIVKLNKLKNAAMIKDDQQLRTMEDQALDQYVKKSQSSFDGVQRAFKAMSDKNKIALTDSYKFGEAAATSFSSHSVSAIKEWGAGTKDAGDAVKEAFLGTIGDMAVQKGEFLLLSSVYPPNPVGLAAGAALIAFGGMLGSMSSGSANSTAGASPSNGANATMGSGIANAAPVGVDPGATTNGNSVNLIVQGHVFSNDSTQRWLVDQIRAAGDATDFKVTSIGG